MKKIVYLITKGTKGGAQKYVYDLATNLPKSTYEPLVMYGTHGKLADDLIHAGIQVREIPSLGRNIALISDIKSFFALFSALRKIRPDIVHLNSSKAAALGALASRLLGIRDIVFTVHGWPFGEKRNVLSKVLIWKISWFTALLSHHVICVSEHDLNMAKKMPFVSRKAVKIYNGINLSQQFGSGESIRAVFPKGAHITGTIGELTKNKNQVALLEEARRTPHMYVAIVGEGELRTALEQKINSYNIADRVKLFGFKPVVEVLKGFDTFALPSIKEGLPYVLIEARLANLPIVANRVGGVGEILDAKDLREFSLEEMLRKTIAVYAS